MRGSTRSHVRAGHPPPPPPVLVAAEMDATGFVPLPVLLRRLQTPGTTEEAVRAIVASDAKGRYQLDEARSPPHIRAVQGHSIQLEAPELAPVTSAAAVPLAVHVTSEEGWAAIQVRAWVRGEGRGHVSCRHLLCRFAHVDFDACVPPCAVRDQCMQAAMCSNALQESGELRRMSRTHIHFSTAARHMRRNSWANVLLQLDLERALQLSSACRERVCPSSCCIVPAMPPPTGRPRNHRPSHAGRLRLLSLAQRRAALRGSAAGGLPAANRARQPAPRLAAAIEQ